MRFVLIGAAAFFPVVILPCLFKFGKARLLGREFPSGDTPASVKRKPEGERPKLSDVYIKPGPVAWRARLKDILVSFGQFLSTSWTRNRRISSHWPLAQ